MKFKKESIPVIATILFLALAVVGIGSGVYFYRQFKMSEAKLQNPTDAAKVEGMELMKKIAKFMVLPNEDPQVATISDVENLKKTQAFFIDAQNNDKLLLFPNAKKAILYRPSTNIVINVAPMVASESANVGSDTGSATPSASAVQTLRIAIRNGSGTTGVTKKLTDELDAKMEHITVMDQGNAKRLDYDKTIVVALSETLDKNLVQQLANALSANVSTLPSDEPKPDADILLIAGKDRK